jgi:hypothetical protein
MRFSAAGSVETGSTQPSDTYSELIIRISTRFGCVWKTRFRDFGINLSCRRYGSLRQTEVELAQSRTVGESCRGIGGLRTDQVCRLKELELEPGRLKQAVTELTLDTQILQSARHCPAPEGELLVCPSH